MNLLPLAFLFFFSSAPDPDADFFIAQARAEPELRIADAYKWLFHAARGGEHAVQNEFAVRKWLDQEWATLGPPQPHEPLWVPLTPDGRIGRLNLRPYRAQNGSPDALHTAFLAGAHSFVANPTRFRAAWNALGRALKTNPQGHLTHSEWMRLDREMRPKDYPARQHSPEYEKSRQPAYRVLPTAQAKIVIDQLPKR